MFNKTLQAKLRNNWKNHYDNGGYISSKSMILQAFIMNKKSKGVAKIFPHNQIKLLTLVAEIQSELVYMGTLYSIVQHYKDSKNVQLPSLSSPFMKDFSNLCGNPFNGELDYREFSEIKMELDHYLNSILVNTIC